jgi:hypothetical protein
MKVVLPILSCCIVLSGCATVTPQWASRQLREMMTETEVVAALGAEPDEISVTTCGQQTAKPWTCKIYRYHAYVETFTIFFSNSYDGQWRVNSW